jgi:prepilin-type N-terminal cleavage/methylation domain-containing protein
MTRRERGFTLLEMMIVIAIIGIILGATIALLNLMFKGESVRQASAIVAQGVAEAKQWAAKERCYFFLVFSKEGEEGLIEIHRDSNKDGIYQGDQDVKTPDADPAVDGKWADLPRFVVFEKSPKWVSFAPSGYMGFSPGFNEIQASSFDANFSGSNPSQLGDIIVKVSNRNFRVCMDLDKATGKVRRSQFLGEN